MITELKDHVQEFFNRYEAANLDFQVEGLGQLYGDVFMFGGPNGVQAIKNEDFLKVLPRRKEMVRSAGLLSSNVESIEVSALDSKYALVKVVWRMRVQRSTKEVKVDLNHTTYILCQVGDSFQIVFQLDHQDLIKNLQDQV